MDVRIYTYMGVRVYTYMGVRVYAYMIHMLGCMRRERACMD